MRGMPHLPAAGFILVAALAGRAQSFDLRDPGAVKPVNVEVKSVAFEGRPCLRVRLAPETQAAIAKGSGGLPSAVALLPSSFRDGILEADVAGEVNGLGGREARGFVGIAFRVSGDASRYEAIYLRMTNGRVAVPVPPAPRIDRAIQYISHPEWTFGRLRSEFPGRYEKGANVAPGRWIHLKIEVDGTTARAWVNGETEPSLVVTDLKMGADAAGAVGLWVDDGSDGYFSNVRIDASGVKPDSPR